MPSGLRSRHCFGLFFMTAAHGTVRHMWTGANRHWSFTVAEVSEAERPGNLLGLGHLIGVPVLLGAEDLVLATSLTRYPTRA
jgi:hypothetical protein